MQGSYPGGAVFDTSVNPVRRLNHAVLFVSDLERSVSFYREALGLEVAAREPAIPGAFLRAPGSGNHHDLGLFEIGAPSGSGAGHRHPGLYHLAWEVDSIHDLADTRTRLADLGALVGQSDHGASKSVYAHDPDGIEFEVAYFLPDWSAWSDSGFTRPLDLEAELRRHG